MIVEIFKDMAGFYRVKYKLSEDESIILKFEKEPNLEEVESEVRKILEARAQSEVSELEEKISELEREIEEIEGKIGV